MQQARAGWVRALRARCTDIRASDRAKKPYLRIAATSGLEELLEAYVRERLFVGHGETEALLDDLLSVKPVVKDGDVAFWDQVVEDMLSRASSECLVAVLAARHCSFEKLHASAIDRVIERLQGSARADVPGPVLLKLLGALQLYGHRYRTFVLDVSRQLWCEAGKLAAVLEEHGADGLRQVLRCWWRAGIHLADRLNPVFKHLASLPLPVPQTAAMLQDLSMHCVLKPESAKSSLAMEYILALLRTARDHETAGRPSEILCAAARIVASPFPPATMGRKREVVALVEECYAAQCARLGDLLTKDARLRGVTVVQLAWVDMQLAPLMKHPPRLLGAIHRQLQAGTLWDHLTAKELGRLLAAAVRAGHAGVLEAICHRLSTHSEPVATPITAHVALPMLLNLGHHALGFHKSNPEAARMGVERLCEVLAERPLDMRRQNLRRPGEGPVVQAGHVLFALARMSFRHQPLLMALLQPPEGQNAKKRVASAAPLLTQLVSGVWSAAVLRAPADAWPCRAAAGQLAEAPTAAFLAAAPPGDVSALVWGAAEVRIAIPEALWGTAGFRSLAGFLRTHHDHAAAVLTAAARSSTAPELCQDIADALARSNIPAHRAAADAWGQGAAPPSAAHRPPHPEPGVYARNMPSPDFDLPVLPASSA